MLACTHARSGDDWLPVLRGTPQGAVENRNPSKFASFVLASFSNRIRNARFTFRGRDYQLRPTSSDGNTHFSRHVPGSGELELGLEAAGVYEPDDESVPSEGMKPIPETLAFSAARAAGGQSLDHVYGGWDGRASLSWPGSGLVIAVACDPVFPHLVVFTAPDGSLAVEPVTHATDGFNLLARGVTGTGVVVLAPGETMAGTATLLIQK